MSAPNIIPIILAGGTGSRLWPLSRASHPKPFLNFIHDDSLIKKTAQRALGLNHVRDIFTITNVDYYLKTKAEYETLKLNQSISFSFLLEPMGKNTAPAIALATLFVQQIWGDDAILLVLPADHFIQNEPKFIASCEQAIEAAKNNYIVTFGMLPHYPETGYGYIQSGEPLLELGECYHAKRFIEKPAYELAESYVAAKNFYWNAGMFCFTAESMLQEFSQHAPELLTQAKTCFRHADRKHADAFLLDAGNFGSLPDISIDYAIMEKSSRIAMLACDFDWHDIGSWQAIKKIHAADEHANVVQGEVLLIDSQDNFIQSHDRLIAAIGIDHLTIIDTADALLISPHHRTQEVRQIAEQLKEQNHPTYHQHRTVIRPWGSYTVLEEAPGYKIKRIEVKPKASLSLQLHHHRSEHWVVVQGKATVLNGEQTYLLNANESTFIPVNTKHRLTNHEDEHLIIIEVQAGAYLGEDDIVRFEDNYGREHQDCSSL